jgi:hypothetical protein
MNAKNLYASLGLIFTLACVLWVVVPDAEGQVASTGAITGTVSDPTGAVVPDAEVTITNTATRQTRGLRTTAAGFYSAEALMAGTYDVTVKKEGFKTYLAQGVKLDPGERVGLNATLELGAATTEVTVTASMVRVETASGESGGSISGNQVQELLLNGRNFLGLALLIPGVNSSAITGRSVGGGSLNTGGLTGESPISINGLGREFNLYTVDGAYNMNTGNNININITTPLDMIAEFRVMKDNYSAKYGVMAGQVMVESKSGTQMFHGSAYEYFRNDKLDSQNFFSTSTAKTQLRYNNFGYSIGGPVTIPNHYNTGRTKTFFFANQEWRRSRAGMTLRGAMIPDDMRNGDFTSSPTLGTDGLKLDSASQALLAAAHPGVNCVPDSTHLNPACFDPNSVALMKQFWPLPNNTAGGFLNYINPGAEAVNQRNDDFRIDHHFSDKLTLMGRFTYENVVDTPPAATWGPNPAKTTTQTIKTTGFNNLLRFTANISPTTINQVTIAQTHDKPRLKSHNDGIPSGFDINYIYPLASADAGRNRIPALSMSGGWAGLYVLDVTASDGELTFADDFTHVRGSHVIQAGMLYIAGVKRQNTFDATSGSFSFSGVHANDPVADYLLGLDSDFTQANTEPRGWFHYRQFEAYIQDDWKATKRLTLNLGLRQAYFSSDTNDANVPSDFDPAKWDSAKAPLVLPNNTFVLDANRNPLTATGEIADVNNGLVYPGQNGVPLGVFTTPHINLGPRIGFAYDVFGNGKTSIRGGYGISYTRIPFGNYNSISNPPLAKVTTLLNGTMTNPQLGSAGAISPSGLSLIGPPGAQFKPTRVQTWSLTVERELSPNSVLSVAYVGTGGRNLQGGRDVNFPLPVAAPSVSDPGCLQTGQAIPAGGFQFDPCLNRGLVTSNITRPFTGWGSMSASAGGSTYYGTSNYHSLQAGFKYRASRNLTLTTAYTWGHVLTDVASRGFDGRNAGAGGQDSRNLNAEYGPAGWDRTHIFTAGYIWNLPFLRDRHDVLGQALGNWTFSGITVIESGFALAPGMSTGDNGLASRPNCVGNVSGSKRLTSWFNTSAFAAPAYGFFGNCGNGIIRGPGENTWNWAFFKSFPIKERAKLQFRAEMFNIWNHPSFSQVSTGLGAGDFGAVTTAMEPRIIELALRLTF